MANDSKKDLDSFLGKVDEIESLVKELNSTDDDIVKTAMAQADKLISAHQEANDDVEEVEGIKTKTGFSKTVINKTSNEDPGMLGVPDMGSEAINQEAFMAVLEADAKERAERRRVREKEAGVLKDKGNIEFKAGNYEAALDLYTQAIDKVRDNMVLYTNRAQTNIKLRRYKDALTDCDWALRISPTCIKAYIHAGRAHLGLLEYDKARSMYRQALEHEPSKEHLIKDYLSEVDRVEQSSTDEQKALELFEAGDRGVQGLVETLHKLHKTDQLPLFYSGGCRVLTSLVNTTEEKALFRSNGGLSLSNTHPQLSRCFSACPESLSKEEKDMLVASLDLFTHVSSDNEANQEKLFESPELANQILRLLEVKMKGQGRMLKSACTGLLFTLSMTNVGRKVVCSKFDLARLLPSMFRLMHKSGAVAIKSVSFLNNMALDKSFRSKLRDMMDSSIFPVFHKLVHSTTCRPEVLVSCVTTMINLASDPHLRAKMRSCREVWEDGIHLLNKYQPSCSTNALHRDMVREVLGMLMNVAVEMSPLCREFGVSVSQPCLMLCLTESVCVRLVERSLILLSYILPHHIPAAEWVCQHEGPRVFLDCVKGSSEVKLKSALKCLTACTSLDNDARSYVVNDKGLGPLKDLLKHPDETVVGNSALCLSHCVQADKAAKVLTKTDVIKDLLVLARDGKRPAVQQNCAILIAKLAQGDTKHLERLRELHGIEILHSCMQYIK